MDRSAVTQVVAADLGRTHEGALQAMNGLEWFEAFAGHEAFHHRQIDDLIAQLSD